MILLQYAVPDAHGALAQAMELAAAKLKRDSATTLFAVQQLTPDEPTLSVVLKGRLATFNEGAAIGEVFGNVWQDKTNPAGEVVVETDPGKGELYVRPVSATLTKPINLFVSTAHATYTLLLQPVDIPADTIAARHVIGRRGSDEPPSGSPHRLTATI